jgi:3-oxoacyl-[acyl-carrier protein] reductase
MKPLAGRVALVTGASRTNGIGASICRRLAADGADVAFTHYSPYDTAMYDAPDSGPNQIQGELEEAGVQVLALEADFSQPGVAGPLFDQVNATLGPVDIVINNAAWSTHDAWDTLTEESMDKHLAVNSRATAMLTVEFARRFARGEGGRVIGFSSGQHLGPMPGELAYAASKGAIIAFCTSVAPDLARRGITINVVNPGPTDTGWIGDGLAARLRPMFPTGRIGQPEDVARLVAWLVSDEAAWVTGQVIDSEGGFMRG